MPQPVMFYQTAAGREAARLYLWGTALENHGLLIKAQQAYRLAGQRLDGYLATLSEAPEAARQERQNLEALLLQFNANTLRVTEELNASGVQDDVDRMWHDHVGSQYRHYASLPSVAPIESAFTYFPSASAIESMLTPDSSSDDDEFLDWSMVGEDEPQGRRHLMQNGCFPAKIHSYFLQFIDPDQSFRRVSGRALQFSASRAVLRLNMLTTSLDEPFPPTPSGLTAAEGDLTALSPAQRWAWAEAISTGCMLSGAQRAQFDTFVRRRLRTSVVAGPEVVDASRATQAELFAALSAVLAADKLGIVGSWWLPSSFADGRAQQAAVRRLGAMLSTAALITGSDDAATDSDAWWRAACEHYDAHLADVSRTLLKGGSEDKSSSRDDALDPAFAPSALACTGVPTDGPFRRLFYLVEALLAFDDLHRIEDSDSALSVCIAIIESACLRRGLPSSLGAILMLHYVAFHLEYTPVLLRAALALVQLLQRRLDAGDVLCAMELELVRRVLPAVHAHVRQCLTHVKRVFPKNQPAGGLALAVDLLTATMRLDCAIGAGGKPVSDYNLDTVLRGYLRENFTCEYQRFLVVALDMTTADGGKGAGSRGGSSGAVAAAPQRATSAGQPLTAAQLILIIDDVVDDVDNFRKHYEPVLSRFLSIGTMAIDEYSSLLFQDVAQFCARHADSRVAMDVNVFRLAQHLHDACRHWSSIAPARVSEAWKDDFRPLAQLWIDQTCKHMSQWLMDSVLADTWAPVRVSLDHVPLSAELVHKERARDASAMTAMHNVAASASLIDLLAMVAQLVRTVRSLDYLTPSSSATSRAAQLAELLPARIMALVRQYAELVLDQDMRDCTAVEQALVQALARPDLHVNNVQTLAEPYMNVHAQYHAGERKRVRVDDIRDGKVRQEMCMRINNLVALLQLHDELVSSPVSTASYMQMSTLRNSRSSTGNGVVGLGHRRSSSQTDLGMRLSESYHARYLNERLGSRGDLDSPTDGGDGNGHSPDITGPASPAPSTPTLKSIATPAIMRARDVEAMAASRQALEGTAYALLLVTTTRINACLLPLLDELVSLRLAQFSVERRFAPIVAHLDAQLFVLLQHLEQSSRELALRTLWSYCVADLYLLARKLHDAGDLASVGVAYEALEYFASYFAARGKGLSQRWLADTARVATGIAALSSLPTEALISLHESLRPFVATADDNITRNEFGCSSNDLVELLRRRAGKSRDAKRYLKQLAESV